MLALTNYFTLTSKNITIWWQNKSRGLVVFKKRNGISPIKLLQFFFFESPHYYWLLNEAVQCKSKTTFCASLAMAWEMQAPELNPIIFFIFRSICMSQNSCFLFVHNFDFQQIIIDLVLYTVFDMSEIS